MGPMAWSNSYAMNLLDSISKALLLGNIESEETFSGTEGVTIAEARADRVSQMITAKVWTPTREVLLRNMRLMGLARFFLPATALRNPMEVAALKLTGDHIPATCHVEPSLVRTFDNMTVPYQINDCEHVLLLDGSRHIPVAVTTKTVEAQKKVVKILSGVNAVQMIPTTGEFMKVMLNGAVVEVVAPQLLKSRAVGLCG